MPVFPIPDDWDGETWGCVLVDWPLSEQWFGILRGFVTTPARGRFWDGSTGSIIDAQAIGLEIEGRNPIVSCEDIAIALAAINVSIQDLDVTSTAQVVVLNDIEIATNLIANSVSQATIDQTIALVAVQIAAAKAEASAYAWSQAFAQNVLGVTVINNTVAQFRPIEVGTDPPPQTSEETPTAITDVLEDTDYDLICRRVYWLLINAKEFYNYLYSIRHTIAGTVLGIMGAAADGLSSASLRAGIGITRFLIPATSILQFAHGLQEAWDDPDDPLELLSDWIDNNYQDLTCEISMAVDGLQSTGFIQNIVFQSAVNWDMRSGVASLANMMFNYSALAGLFYTSPLLDTAPPIPASEPANICTACGG